MIQVDKKSPGRNRIKGHRRTENGSNQQMTKNICKDIKRKDVIIINEMDKKSKISSTCRTPPTYSKCSTLPRTNVPPSVTQTKSTTLPKGCSSYVPQSSQYSSLPRQMKPPRRPSGYVSPAVKLKRHSKIETFKEQYKGLNVKTFENLPCFIKNVALKK